MSKNFRSNSDLMNQKMRKKINCPMHFNVKCCKYIQPSRPESFKPILKYGAPEHALESRTVYNTSYPGVEPEVARECRPAAYIARGNINLLAEPLENTTTMNLSYKWDCPASLPPQPYRPLCAITLPKDPMKSMTTQRHDFEKKPFIQSEIVIPKANLALLNAKIEDKTITSESYQKPENPEVLSSCKPIRVYEPPTLPMDRETINTGSYVWPPLCPIGKMPWIPDRSYQIPTQPMQEKTIYNTSFLPPGIEICDFPCVPQYEKICTCCIPTATEDLD